MTKTRALPVLLSVLIASPALAESLTDTLVDTYAGNATIQAQRYGQRGTDEKLSEANSGWRPSQRKIASGTPTLGPTTPPLRL